MGQFKPMVKMMTTEPSVELKLKKGGKVAKKMQTGGTSSDAPSMPARGGMLPTDSPMKPSMAARRRAMMAMPAGAAPAAPVGMASRMMKEGGKSKAAKNADADEKKMARGGYSLPKANLGARARGVISPHKSQYNKMPTVLHPRVRAGQVNAPTSFIPYAARGLLSRGRTGSRFAEGGEAESGVKKADEKKMARGGKLPRANLGVRARGVISPHKSQYNKMPNVLHPRVKAGQINAPTSFIPYAARTLYARRRYAEGGETTSEHKAEMAKMAKTAEALKKHADKPASKAHKGLKTGGVVMGQGGYKAGGIINTENQGGEYRNTKMDTTKPDHSPAKTGGVKMGNGGGYATGGVAKSNGGGYRKGGAAKKHYAAGGVVDSGAPVAMPQGRKKPSTPVSINQLSGTFKKGGSVTAAEGRLQKNFKSENATAMKQAKAYSNEVYSKYGKKMKEGGKVDLSKGAYDKSIGPSEEEMEMAKLIRSIPRRMIESAKSLFGEKETAKPAGSVTKTEKSVTVEPAKKRGGAVKC